MLSWQGELLLMRSADKEVPVGSLGRQTGPLKPPAEALLYDPDALGKRWEMVQVKARQLPADHRLGCFL